MSLLGCRWAAVGERTHCCLHAQPDDAHTSTLCTARLESAKSNAVAGLNGRLDGANDTRVRARVRVRVRGCFN